MSSQIFANIYLNQFDHWIQESHHAKAYIRYVDDIWVFAQSKTECWQMKSAMEKKLAQLRLTFHPNKTMVYPSSIKQDVLGYQASPCKRWLRNDNGFRFRRKLNSFSKQYAKGKLNFSDMLPSIMSWVGHARHGETKALVNSIFKEVVFSRQ